MQPSVLSPRSYRLTVLEVLGLASVNLGEAFVCCGITALSGYCSGSILVDHL